MTRLARGTCDDSVEPGKGDKPIFLMLAERALSRFAGHIEEDTENLIADTEAQMIDQRWMKMISDPT